MLSPSSRRSSFLRSILEHALQEADNPHTAQHCANKLPSQGKKSPFRMSSSMAFAAAGSEASSSSTVIFVILSCTRNKHRGVSV